MIYLITVCGPAGWGLFVVSIVVAVMVLSTVVQLIRGGSGRRLKLQHKLNALLFWGFMGAVLGFLGQTSAIHNAMTAIIPAKSISPEMIDRGFREAFIPSFWGFGILVTSALLYLIFRLIARNPSQTGRDGTALHASGPAGAALILIVACVFCLPALSYAAQGNEIPEILTSNVWVGKGGPDDVVFKVWVTQSGSPAGEAHTLRNGKHMTQSPAVQVMWDVPRIEWHMNTGVIYRGKLDEAGNRIEGELIYNGKSIGEMPLAGMNPNDVAGLSARPVPAPGEPLYSYTVPAKMNDGWTCEGPEAVGLEKAQLEALVSDVIAGKAGILHSLLLVKNGKLVLEEYFHGYEREDLHRLASDTKSVSSLLIGIAIDRGEIAGVDAGLADFFPQHKELLRNEWNNVTLKHVLTMSVGTEWTEEEADRTHGAGDAFFAKLFSRDFAHKPGEKWQYVSANVNILGGVLKHATGMHADQFAAEYLFKPLGIEKWNWEYGAVDGYRLMDGSLMLRPRDMAKLGALIAGKGEWNGKRVVSAEWVAESTSPMIVPSDKGPEKYGYLWWLFYIPTSAGVQEAVVANGKGSQLIAVFPSLDLIVVTTGSNDENGMQFAIGRLLSVHILDRIAEG